MFVRKKQNRSGSISVQIIKKINRSNKVLKTVGSSSVSEEVEILYKKALYELPRLYGYVTNTRLTGDEVIDNYNNLWKIEKAFRISKTDLKISPIYHRIRERIEAHICISFVSYLMYKELERILQENNSGISVKKAIKSINKMYVVVSEGKNGKIKSILIGKNVVQQEIIDIVNNFF